MNRTLQNKVTVSDPTRIVTHTRYGIWDYFEELDPDAGQTNVLSSAYTGFRETFKSLPYVIRAMKDVLAIPGCKSRVAIYAISQFAGGMIPAISIW